MADTTPKKKEPTAAEAMFFFAIVKHTRNKADIDWAAVAEEQNFKSAEVAKVRFGQVKRKLGISSDSPNSSAAPKASVTGETPTKVTKATGRAGGKGKSKTKTGVKMEIQDKPGFLDDTAGGRKIKSEIFADDNHGDMSSFLHDEPF